MQRCRHDFIAIGGGVHISEQQSSSATSSEQVIADNPDVIIAMMGSESGLAVHQKKNWMTMPVIKAVMDDRVHVLDPDLVCSPSPATFAKTLRLIAGLIHPNDDGFAAEPIPFM